MKELLETLIKSQRDRLEVYSNLKSNQIQLMITKSSEYNESEFNMVIGKYDELQLCLSQSINLYNQIKNDSESTTTI